MSGEALPAWSGDDQVIRLTDELRRIASRIRDTVPSRRETTSSGQIDDRPDYLTLAETVIAMRRRIENHFSAILFGDPARDLLLDLYASGLRGKIVSVSSACIAASVPATTALRWIRKLEQDGLIELKRDPSDNRRVLVRLSDTAKGRMEAYMIEVARLLSWRD